MKHRSVLFYNPANGKPSSTSRYLNSAGYECQYSTTREEALQKIQVEKPDAVLIFADNCGDEAYTFCQFVRQNPPIKRTSLVMISSRSDEEDIVRGLEAGADQYVTNLRGPRELVARLRAMIRRANEFDAARLKIKDIEIDLEEHQVTKAGRPVDLTYIQFKLLYLLASRRNSIFSRKEILDKVWGRNVCVTSRTVDVHVKRLREKLGEYKYPSRYIETVHGTGYRFMQ